jgi:hypothetical protein
MLVLVEGAPHLLVAPSVSSVLDAEALEDWLDLVRHSHQGQCL